MTVLRAVLHIAHADVLERTRRYGFLGMVAGTLYLAFAIGHGDLTMKLDSWCGVMNSAWVGGMVATSAIIFISLFGFYFVKNTIERDTQTGVGQIIAATPVTRVMYLLGKWLSNWAVLSALIGILVLAAGVLLATAHGPTGFQIAPLVSPFVLLGLPAMSFVAALALFFETVPGLRGGTGNVLYFFVWSGILAGTFLAGNLWFDWTGIVVIYRSMGEALRAIDPAYTGSFNLTGRQISAAGLHTFTWHGINWSADILLSRALWVLFSVALTLSGGLFFTRFDTSKTRLKKGDRRRGSDVSKGSADGIAGSAPGADIRHARFSITPVRMSAGSTIMASIISEVRVTLKGWPWWWYAGAVGVIIAGCAHPIGDARQYWLPVAWLWPVLIWSGLGTREARYMTDLLLLSSPRPFTRQIVVAWLAGVVVAMVTGSGVACNCMLSGAWSGLGAWCAGAMFIPALALAAGIWTRTSKTFEIVYVLLWYLGPLHPADIPAMDFLGATDASIALGMPVIYATCAASLVALACLGRWLHMRS